MSKRFQGKTLHVQSMVTLRGQPVGMTYWFSGVILPKAFYIRGLDGDERELPITRLASRHAGWENGGWFADLDLGSTRYDIPDDAWLGVGKGALLLCLDIDNKLHGVMFRLEEEDA